MHGTCGGACDVGWQIAAPNYVIQAGDVLYWRQYQSSGVAGGLVLQFQDGTDSTGLMDTAGQPADALATDGAWVNRAVAAPAAAAGKTVTALDAVASSVPAAGPFDLYFGDLAIVHADGTVTTIYDRQPGVTLPLAYNVNNAATGLSAASQWVASHHPVETTTYFLADQIGSTRMTLTAGGWPVTGDTYYPFGVEIGSSASPDRYKFSGKERDRASGLDNFGARYYSAVMGRFMTPDWRVAHTSLLVWGI